MSEATTTYSQFCSRSRFIHYCFYCDCCHYNSSTVTKYNLGKVNPWHIFLVLEDMNMKPDKYRQGKVYVQTTVSKSLPRQSEVAQGVPGKLRPRIILTFRHYKCGRSSAKRTDRLYPRRNTWYSLSEAESTSGHMVLLGVPRKKSPVTLPGIDPGTVRLVAQYATPGSTNDSTVTKYCLLM
jgi:hypothetical protein